MGDATPNSSLRRPLLKTKLFVPRLRSHPVRRAELLAQLDDGMRRKLTLVVAPPGFGKTSLISEWRLTPGGRDTPLAWLSLDPADDDPARFWFYVVAAMESLYPGVGSEAQAMLRAPHGVAPESILLALINSAADVASDFALVLDDLHLITSPGIYEGLTFLVEHLPPQLHLIFITRVDPPLPLARLRAQDDLIEIRAKDLRFTDQEAAGLLRQSDALDLSLEQIDLLTTRTEGWAVGLQLAALALRSSDDLPGTLVELLGNHRYIVDYLGQEVLQRQPEPIKQFLLATCVLDRLSGPLCDAVTGGHDSQSTLAWLEQAGLFTTPMDNERRWYRYHQLFADVLRAQLETFCPGEAVERSRSASRWYEQNGLLVEAVQASLTAGDFVHTADLLQLAMDELMRRGEMSTLLRLLGALPDAIIRTRPGLCAAHARLLAATSGLAAAEQRVTEGELALSHVDQTDEAVQHIAGRVMVMRAVITRLRGELHTGVSMGEQALAQLASQDAGWRSFLWVSQATGLWSMGEQGKAAAAISTASHEAERAGDLYVAALSRCSLGEMMEFRGDLSRACDVYREALQIGDGIALPCAGWARVGMARVLCEWNRAEEAGDWVAEGIHHGERFGHVDTLWRGYLVQLNAARSQGDHATAQRCVEQISAVAKRSAVALIGEVEKAARVLMHLDAGRVSHARSGFNSLAPGWESTFHWIFPSLGGQLLLAEDRLPEAAALLIGQIAHAQAVGHDGTAVHLRITLTLVYEASGDLPAALRVLAEATAQGEATGFVRAFTCEGAPMARLLRQLPPRAYIDQLLACFPFAWPSSVEPATGPQKAAQPLVEPLSVRELEVLQLLAAGQSNQAIAEHAFIAVGTVKRHVHNILAKLGAHDRSEAVKQARALGLLS